MVINEYVDTNLIDTIHIDTIMCLHSRIIFIIDITYPQMVIVCKPSIESYVWFVDPRKRYNNITIDIMYGLLIPGRGITTSLLIIVKSRITSTLICDTHELNHHWSVIQAIDLNGDLFHRENFLTVIYWHT